MSQKTRSFHPGSYHNVTCVRTIWTGHHSLKHEWIPVLGAVHEDQEIIGFPYLHWHVDRRFLHKKKIGQLNDDRTKVDDCFRLPITNVWPDCPGVPSQGIQVSQLQNGSGAINQDNFPESSYLRVMRRRLTAPYPQYPGPDRVPWLPPLHQAFLNAHLIYQDGHPVCPHRQTPLTGLEPGQDGCVTCPLHGLRWNLQTGRLSPPPSLEALMQELEIRRRTE